jgi:dihydrofolate reductase
LIRSIAAIDSRRGIATDSGIPWKLPGDSAYFREQTSSGLIVMGRATYDEFAAPLHDRGNYVFSTRPGPLRDGFQVVASLDRLTGAHPGEDVWVIGGATVYAKTLDQVQELLLTQVMGDFDCTKFFPPYTDSFGLRSRSEEREEGGVRYRFETWRRLDTGRA